MNTETSKDGTANIHQASAESTNLVFNLKIRNIRWAFAVISKIRKVV
jgi:hypothetical protein